MSASVQFDGVADSNATTFAAERAFWFQAPTFTSQATSTAPETYPDTTIVDQAATVYIDSGPKQGLRMLCKESFALWVGGIGIQGGEPLSGILLEQTAIASDSSMVIRNAQDATASVSKATPWLLMQAQGYNNTSVSTEYVNGALRLQTVEEASGSPSAYFEFAVKALATTDPWSHSLTSPDFTAKLSSLQGWLMPTASTAAAPPYSFDGDEDTGVFQQAANALGLATNGEEALRVDNDSTAGNTRFLIYDVDNATLERVSVGAADSGGSGYKVLRIVN
jgi:hypothetical protein